MPRTLRIFGCVLLATLAVSVTVVRAAQAEQEGRIVSGSLSASLSGTDALETNGLSLRYEGTSILCSENNLAGELPSGAATTLTLALELGGPQSFQSCIAAGAPATIDNNGCDLVFETFETTNGGTWGAGTTLACPAGQPGIQVTAFGGASHGFRICTITFPPQAGFPLDGATLHNNTGNPDDLTVTMELGGLSASQSGLCGESSTQIAELNGEFTLTAENQWGEPIDLYVEHRE